MVANRRIYYEYSMYHVMSRGNNKLDVLRSKRISRNALDSRSDKEDVADEKSQPRK